MLQLDAGTARKLSRRLRKVTTRLGTVRELDVLLLLIDELHVSAPQPKRRARRASASASRRTATTRENGCPPPADCRHAAPGRRSSNAVGEQLRTSPRRAVVAGRRRATGAGRSRRSVARAPSRLSAAIAEAGAVYLPERLHAVRIAVKKLRYASSSRPKLAGASSDAELQALKRGQELLGRMHDLQVLIDRVRAGAGVAGAADVTVWRELDALVVSLEDDCRRLHARYMRARDDRSRRSRDTAQRAAAAVGVAPRGQARRRRLIDARTRTSCT